MIGLSSPLDPTDPAVCTTPGGFAWWYVDLVDEAGNGLVLIWSLNLPFLPDVSYGVRAGGRPVPADHPSLNIVVHRAGKPAFYLLQQSDPGDWSWSADDRRWQIGESRIAVDRLDAGCVRLRAHLRTPIPGQAEPFTGEVEITGPLRQVGQTADPRSPHLWCPLVTAATGRAHLRWGDTALDLQGRAYFDRNACDRPITELGIRQWSWGRLPFAGRELIWYHLAPEDPELPARSIVLEVLEDGSSARVEDVELVATRRRRGRYGLRYPRALRFADPSGRPVEVRVTHVVEDGPFYQRFSVSARCGTEEVEGVAELVYPARIALPGLRPLIEMRVHRLRGRNSFWLPLFTGGRRGRIERLVGQLRGRPALPGPAPISPASERP